MTTTCTACGAEGQSGAFCSVCGTPTVAAGLGPTAMSARLETTTQPEARELTRQAPAGVVRAATPVGGAAPGSSLPLAGVGRRVGAYVLDVVAVSLVVGIASGVVAAAVDLPGKMAAYAEATTDMGAQAATSEMVAATRSVAMVGAILALLAWFGLALWEGRTGGTVGNRLLGIRTHRAPSGSGTPAAADAPLGAGRALLRWLILALAGVVPLVGTILMLLSPLFDASGRRQGWHDKVAGSVVHDVRAVPPRSFAPASASAPRAAEAARVPVSAAAPASAAVASDTVLAAALHGPNASSARQLTPEASGPSAVTAVQPAAGPTSSVDPWAFPVGGRTVASSGGLITGVPGLGGEPAPAHAPEGPAPTSPATTSAGAELPAPTVEPDEDLEATRFGVSSRRATGDGGSSAPAATIDLPSGRRVRIDSRTLLGRNPQRDGAPAVLLQVEDPSRSVSKTHLELVPTPDGLRVTDLRSTNGTAAITPAGEVRELSAGVPAVVGTGWAVQAGDLRFTVGGPVGA